MRPTKTLDIDLTNLDESLQVIPEPRLLTSHSSGWENIGLEHVFHSPWEYPEHRFQQHVLLINLKAESGSERRIGASLEREEIQVGDVVLIPANVETWKVSRQDVEKIGISLKPEFVAQTAYESLDLTRIELTPQFARPDPLIEQIGRSLLKELQSDYFGCRLYAESLANALAVHLLWNYATHPPKIRESEEGLPHYKLKRTLDYIHAHLDQNIQIADLAKVLGMSRYYFSRLFRQSMGITPYQYVIQQRVERAKRLLRQQRELPISEIALHCGFTHQSHMAKYFRQLTRMTPKAYRDH